METIVNLDLRSIDTPMRIWTRFPTMSYRLMLRKMNPNKTETTGNDGTAIAPSAEETQLHRLNVFQHPMDHVI
jgi:hypothetical protein